MTNTTTGIIGWAPEPEGRGTIGLLWSCFATIFLCTWSAIHPNLPDPEDSKSKVFWRRVKYGVLCLGAPEWFALDALSKLSDARRLRAKSPKWSLKKCFFFLMGGFSIEYESGGQRHRKRFCANRLVQLFTGKSLDWPKVDEAEIDDHSKADGLVKLLALSQIIWFVTQAIGRAAQGLAVSTLELFTLGIVLWAMMIYGVLWEMPFDVQRPLIIQVQVSEEIINRESDFTRVKLLDWTYVHKDNNLLCLCICAITSLGFSALHIIAWSFHFPTNAELWLWRVSSIVCTISPLIFIVEYWWLSFYKYRFTLLDLLIPVAGGAYCICRAYMFVEMFVGLRAAPTSIYETTQWSQYLPSIS